MTSSNVLKTGMKQIEVCREEVVYALNQFFLNKNGQVLSEWHLNPNEETLQLAQLELTKPIRFVRGGQGYVYSVYDSRSKRHSALKMKLKESRSKSTWLRELQEEQVLRSIQHPFIVTLLDSFCTEEALFLNMEFIDGGCLWSHIAYNGLLPENTVAYYTACIILALDYLHDQGIIFRDLKAENIVLDWHRRPRLIDFGMAKFLKEQLNVEPGAHEDELSQYAFTGYLAPEMYLKSHEVDCSIDAWGVGYLLTQMHLGFGVFMHIPWERQPGRHLVKNWRLVLPGDLPMSPSYKHLVEGLLKQTPAERLSLEEVKQHSFLSSIKWNSLPSQLGPNLKTLNFIPMRQTEYLRNRNINCDMSGQYKTAGNAASSGIINSAPKCSFDFRLKRASNAAKESFFLDQEKQSPAVGQPKPSFSLTVGNLKPSETGHYLF